MRQLLDDVAVVEIAMGSIAASYCGKLFADIGADVIKVEPPTGDPLRAAGYPSAGPRPDLDSSLFRHLNTNKRSVVVDPSSADGQAQLWALLEGVDLLIESEGQGSLHQWGLTWDALHERFPGLTVTTVTGFGAEGPYSNYKSEDLVDQAVAGVLLFQGRTDQDLLKLPANTAMYMAGNMAALGSLGSVTRAKPTGVGAHIDSSAVEALATMPLRATALLSYEYAEHRPRSNSVTDGQTLVPMGVYPCADGYVAVVTMIQQLSKLMDLVDDDELRRTFEDPDALTRPETREVVDSTFYPWLLARTRAEATREAQLYGFPLTGVLSLREVLEADHLHQRGFWVQTNEPGVGSLEVPGPPYRHAEGGWALHRSAPALGQHDNEILGRDRSAGSHLAARPVRGTTSALPLEGVRVLDMTAVYAGPFVTMLLADLGAEVIRVENPWVYPPSTKGFQPRPSLPPELLGQLASGYGPLAEGRPDRPYNRHSMNNSVSRNKLSCAIDIRRPEGRELFMRLIEISDVFVESFKSTSLGSIGIYPDELEARNPRLIVARIPPAGLNGEWSKWTGFGQNFDALSGLISISGHRDTTPVEAPGIMHMDCVTGPAAAFAILSALHYRGATGRGNWSRYVSSRMSSNTWASSTWISRMVRSLSNWAIGTRGGHPKASTNAESAGSPSRSAMRLNGPAWRRSWDIQSS